MKKVLLMIFMFGIGLGLGMFIPWVIGEGNMDKMGVGLCMASGFAMILGAYVILIFTTIVHEFGHLVCGLKSGYKFVSFRVLSFSLCKYEDGYKMKRFAIPGTGGQCLMAPPEYNEGKYPYKLYLSGGNIATAILLSIEALIVLLVGTDYFVARVSLMAAIISLYLLVMNGIPMKVSGIANDAYDVKNLDKNPEQKRELWQTLDVNAKTHNGALLSEVGIDFNGMDDDESLKGIAGIGMQMKLAMKINYLVSEKRFDDAYSLCKKILAEKEVIELYKNELKCDKMFLEIVLGKELKLKKTYSKMLKNYIRTTYKYMLPRKRLMYAYYLLIEKDLEKAAKEKESFIIFCSKASDLGEIKSERNLMEYIDTLHSQRLEVKNMED